MCKSSHRYHQNETLLLLLLLLSSLLLLFLWMMMMVDFYDAITSAFCYTATTPVNDNDAPLWISYNASEFLTMLLLPLSLLLRSLQDARASPTASRNFYPIASSTSSLTARRARQYIKKLIPVQSSSVNCFISINSWRYVIHVDALLVCFMLNRTRLAVTCIYTRRCNIIVLLQNCYCLNTNYTIAYRIAIIK